MNMSTVKVVSKTMVYAAPEKGMSAYEMSFYTQRAGIEKVRMRLLDISDDVPGPREVAFSKDNGKTWPETLAVRQPRKVEGGTLREWPCSFFVDPINGRQVVISLEGVFPADTSEAGAKNYYAKYRTSADGGRTALVEEQIIQRGFTPEHPMPGMWIGRNGFSNSGHPSMLRLPDGRLLLVLSKMVHGPDGELYNPGGGMLWLEIQVLHGFWREDGGIDWHAGAVVAVPPTLSSWGIYEPSLALMPDGRVMMIMRNSNGGKLDRESKLPAHKWISISSDHGATWTFPEAWTYDDGEAFYSPSSICQLMWHSNGKLYWLGNISNEKPVNGGHREKLFIGEIDPRTLCLVRKSLCLIAQRGEGEPPTQLSNFYAHEDRETREIVLYLPWFVEQEPRKWGADSWLYRLAIE